MTNTIKVKLVNYFDVWGNEEEGWEINNLCNEGDIELPEEHTNADILAALIEIDFLKDTVTEEMIRFDDLFDFGVELYEAANDYPLCRIEYYHN